MNWIIKGMTYRFHRNLGLKDRIIRTLIGLVAIASWYFGAIAGIIGISIAVLEIMILRTAVSSRCALTYLNRSNTMSADEKSVLDQNGIKYEV